MFLINTFLTSRPQRYCLASLRSFWAAAASAAETTYREQVSKVTPPLPGTVTPYFHHIFLRSAPQQTEEIAPGAWWPQVVERLPPFLATFSAIAHHRKHIDGIVKVTAYEHANPILEPAVPPEKVDMLIYPAGVWFKRLPMKSIDHVIATLVAEPTEDDPDFSPPLLQKRLTRLVRHVPPLGLFVCCHGHRDIRCGVIGDKLVQKLQVLIQEREWQENVKVFRCSHVGGHKYAGNVVVYSAISPCDGDWFGGVNPENAEQFLDAVADVQFGGSGGVSDETLRKHWRGRMGLSKDEHLQAFERKALAFADEESGEELLEDDADSNVEGMDGQPWSDLSEHIDNTSSSSSDNSSDSSSNEDD